jgi:integrase
MPAKSITDAFARNVKLPRKPNQVPYIDTLERGLALVLVVSYGGAKTFRVMTYRNGKPRTAKLGTYPAMKVAEARKLARFHFEHPDKAAAEAAAGTFAKVADDWLKRHVAAKKLRSEREVRRILDRYVYPKWADHPFVEIRRGDVNALLDHVYDRHGPAQADAVLAMVRGIMGWYESRNEHYSSPVVRRMRRGGSTARTRVLSDDELRAVWRATRPDDQFGAFVRLALLTAQRRAKLASLRWDDLVDGTWIIRTEPREKGNPGALKLPPQALDILDSLPRIFGNPFVFAGQRGRGANAWYKRKAELDAKLPPMERWTIHDLRRTARSLMSRAGVSSDHAERVMGHAIGGVEGVYDRHAYTDEKAAALMKLASLIESIVDPPAGNVVPMRGR